MKRLILAFGLVLIALSVWVATRRSAAVQVQAEAVKSESISSTITTNAVAEPGRWQQIVAQAQGPLVRLDVRSGESVRAGQSIGAIDDPMLQSEIAAAESRLVQAQHALETARRGGLARETAELNAQRAKAALELEAARRELAALERLISKGAATRTEADAVKDRAALLESELKSIEARRGALVETGEAGVAESRVRDARAALESLNRRARQAAVIAPFAGVVYDVAAHRGDWLAAGAAIAKIGDISTLRLRVYVDEPDLARVTPGMTLTATWDALPGRTFNAKIVQLPAQITAMGTRMVGEVIATLENPESALPPGANMNAEIQAGRVESALTIPKSALRRNEGRTGVLVVERGVLVWREITLGVSGLHSVQVVSGLKAGELVLTSPDASLAAGARVEPATPAAR